MKKIHDPQKQLFILGMIFPIAAAFLWLFYDRFLKGLLPFQGCVWDQLFGFYCPGCGGTRAMEALLHGQFLLSFWYHPIVCYSAVIYGCFMISQAANILTRGRIHGIRFHGWFLYGAILIILLNWLVKNLLRMKWGITL